METLKKRRSICSDLVSSISFKCINDDIELTRISANFIDSEFNNIRKVGTCKIVLDYDKKPNNAKEYIALKKAKSAKQRHVNKPRKRYKWKL